MCTGIKLLTRLLEMSYELWGRGVIWTYFKFVKIFQNLTKKIVYLFDKYCIWGSEEIPTVITLHMHNYNVLIVSAQFTWYTLLLFTESHQTYFKDD